MHSLIAVIFALVASSVANVINFRVSVDDVSADSDAAWSCRYYGTAPFCAGACPNDRIECGSDQCGGGKCCATGSKKLCCRENCYGLTHEIKNSQNKGIDAPHSPHGTGDNYDDICGKGDRIYCPLDAKKNDDCICLPKGEGDSDGVVISRWSQSGLQHLLGDPDDSICGSAGRIYCPPGPNMNKQCRCYKE